MILVDTSIWVDHIRAGDPTLTSLLLRGTVLVHPFVIGELAVGNLKDRSIILRELGQLNFAAVASHAEVLGMIDRHRLYGLGLGYVDCHLLAGVRLTPGSSFWTRDKRLLQVASRLGVAATFPNDADSGTS